ncbi:MAG: hypothetical protein AAFQ01_01365, partial [Bacteroidota bacterium]
LTSRKIIVSAPNRQVAIYSQFNFKGPELDIFKFVEFGKEETLVTWTHAESSRREKSLKFSDRLGNSALGWMFLFFECISFVCSDSHLDKVTPSKRQLERFAKKVEELYETQQAAPPAGVSAQ